MNIINLHHSESHRPVELGCLFDRMQASMRSANADFEKSIRLAKTLAPLLSDKTSNERHLRTLASNASVQEKVIAILMLGFPNNRTVLPVLQDIMHNGTKSMRMASALAISQMRDGANNALFGEILLAAHHQEKTLEVRTTIRHALMSVLGKQTPLLDV